MVLGFLGLFEMHAATQANNTSTLLFPKAKHWKGVKCCSDLPQST